MVTVSSVPSEIPDKMQFLDSIMLFTFGRGALNGLLPLHFSETINGGVLQSVICILSAEVSEHASTILQKRDFEGWSIPMLFDWAQALSSTEELKIYLSDRFPLQIWYLHQQYVWPLESLFPWYFAACWTERKTQQKADLPLLLFWWRVCERPRILNLNQIYSVHSLMQVSKQFWR